MLKRNGSLWRVYEHVLKNENANTEDKTVTDSVLLVARDRIDDAPTMAITTLLIDSTADVPQATKRKRAYDDAQGLARSPSKTAKTTEVPTLLTESLNILKPPLRADSVIDSEADSPKESEETPPVTVLPDIHDVDDTANALSMERPLSGIYSNACRPAATPSLWFTGSKFELSVLMDTIKPGTWWAIFRRTEEVLTRHYPKPKCDVLMRFEVFNALGQSSKSPFPVTWQMRGGPLPRGSVGGPGVIDFQPRSRTHPYDVEIRLFGMPDTAMPVKFYGKRKTGLKVQRTLHDV